MSLGLEEISFEMHQGSPDFGGSFDVNVDLQESVLAAENGEFQVASSIGPNMLQSLQEGAAAFGRGSAMTGHSVTHFGNNGMPLKATPLKR